MNVTKSRMLERAEEAARFLLSCPAVIDVYLFGSLAREGDGKDIDLIAITSESEVEQFADFVWEEYVNVYSLAAERFCAAGAILRWDDRGIFRVLGHDALLDIFIFPVDWLARLDELQGGLPHQDVDFMKNIAFDARKFNPDRGEFRLSPSPITRERIEGDLLAFHGTGSAKLEVDWPDSQFGVHSVIIKDPSIVIDDVIELCERVGAINTWECPPGEQDYVVQFWYDKDARFPQVFTKDAIHRSLKHDSRVALR